VKGSLGLLLLIDLSGQNPAQDLSYYMSLYADQLENTPCVIGLTHADLAPGFNAEHFHGLVEARGFSLPIISIDARNVSDVTTALELLLAQAMELEYREAVA
jgi:signal recognition particle receptor subunit beta